MYTLSRERMIGAAYGKGWRAKANSTLCAEIRALQAVEAEARAEGLLRDGEEEHAA